MTASVPMPLPASIDETLQLLEGQGYVADRALATTVFLCLRMQRPLFLEGEAGTGKTEVAKILAAALNRPLIRLQCYEGLDVAQAVYEWNYPAQLLHLRVAEARQETKTQGFEDELFSPRFLIKRPVLQALETREQGAPIFLIDELDRADEAFEAYLLEVLADNQVTIPEIGRIEAEEPPITLITGNRTREVHDALKRRCLYHWVDYPDFERELQIVEQALPGINAALARAVVHFVQSLREDEGLFKRPGIAETLDWAAALIELDAVALTPELAELSLGALLKYQEDITAIRGKRAATLLEEIEGKLATELNAAQG
ncbi:AAA family ATPase [Polycladidibacter hongkongensis]|uniref:AAA family ATPase n=1 Tax=Polycladidibacter hongkongensis TaxID=1647556 RepID=UPI000832C92C|nr:MoxR family ATPase [Pseudovibrio hongkongensis]